MQSKLRLGIDSPDTSHVRLFTQAFHDTDEIGTVSILTEGSIRDESVIASFVAENEIALHYRREDFLQSIDAVLLLGVDWSAHIDRSLPSLAGGKRIFIDKPVAGSYADIVRLRELLVQYPGRILGGSALPHHPAFTQFLESFRFFVKDASASVEISGSMDSYFMASHSYELASTMLGDVKDAVVEWREHVTIHSAIGQHEVTITLKQAPTLAEHPWSIRARIGKQLLLVNFPLEGIYDGLLRKIEDHLLHGSSWGPGTSIELALAAERSGHIEQAVSILDLDLRDVIPSETFVADYKARNGGMAL